jgi:hypothetical protein
MPDWLFEWANRAGIILGFLSFWFAAPEFIGEERLKAWERSLERVLRGSIPLALGLTIGCGVVFLAFVCGIAAWTLLSGILPLLSSVEKHVLSLLFIASFMLGLWVGHDAADWGTRRIVRPLLARLAEDEAIRRRCLMFGALLFILGTALQLFATFEPRTT